MRKVMLILAVVACFGVTGCATKSAYIDTPNAEYVEPTAQFTLGEVVDRSGFYFAPDDKDAFSLTEAMQASLQTELGKRSAPYSARQYAINVEILKYVPGNAGLRWLMPGLGATRLSVNAIILDGNGNPCAHIPVERSIAIGGAFTVGAWKYVFDEVAAEIVDVLTNADNRTQPNKRKDNRTRP